MLGVLHFKWCTASTRWGFYCNMPRNDASIISQSKLWPTKHEEATFLSYEPAPWGPSRLKTSSLCYTPLPRINQWADSFGELPFPAFSCLYDEVQTRSRCGEPLKKTQSHADAKNSGVMQESNTLCPLLSCTPLTCRWHHNTEQQVCCFSLHVSKL